MPFSRRYFLKSVSSLALLGVSNRQVNAGINNPGSFSGTTGDEVELTSLIGSSDGGFWNQTFNPNNFRSNSVWQPQATTPADAAGMTTDGIVYGSITETATTGNHGIFQTVIKPSATNLTYTMKARVKAGIRSRMILVASNTDNSAGAFVCFDLAGSQIGVAANVFGSGFTAGAASISAPDGDGFNTVSYTFITGTAANIDFYAQLDANSGTAALNNSYAGNSASPAISICDYTAVQSLANGNVLANLTDGDPSTFWQASGSQSWAGFDAGVPVAFTGYAFAPCDGSGRIASLFHGAEAINPGFDYDSYPQGRRAEIATNATFTAGVSTVDTIPLAPNYPRFDLAERRISGTARYFRLKQFYGNLSALKAYCTYTAGITNARPMKPTISPYGGRFPAGSATVMIACRTKSVQIYYTTDGTTPDNTKTLYTAPFSLAMGGVAKTLKVVAFDNAGRIGSTYSEVATSHFTPWAFVPNEDWYDDQGNLIEAHGGNIIYVASKSLYYWCGSLTNKFTSSSLVGGLTRQDLGVWLYASPDLYNWTKIGQILGVPNDGNGVPYPAIERPHIVFNASTGKFVLWAHADTTFTTTSGRAAIATSSAIDSGWSWQSSYLPSGANAVRDLSLFVDDNGDGYCIFADGSQVITIAKLASDYLTAVSTYQPRAGALASQESPVLLKIGAQYFLICGDNFGYTASGNGPNIQILTNTNIAIDTWTGAGGWGASGGPGTNFCGQPSFAFKPQGKSQYFLGTDRWWNGIDLYHSRQCWLPLNQPGGAASLSTVSISPWDLSNLT